MKILLFTDTFYDANGVSRFLQDIAYIANEKECKLTIITSSLKKFGDKNLPNVINTTPSLRMKMPFYNDLDLTFPSLKRVFELFRDIDPDIVHISTPGFIGFIGRYLAKKYDKVLVGTYHTNFPAYIKKNTNSSFAYNITIKFMRYFYKPFSLVFSRSNEYITHLEKNLKLNPKNLQILPHGIDIESFSPNLDTKDITKLIPNATNADIKAIYVGRFTKEKNFSFLLKIWKKFNFLMQKEGKKTLLICLGEGRYIKQKDMLKIHNIFLLDKKPKEELAPFYTFADFFLFPSTTDTLGQVVMEALACKTTVIVSDKGGPKNIIKNGNKPCGVVQSIDEDLWVDTMIDLVNNPQKIKDYAKNGYEMMQKHSILNSFDTFIKSHEELYIK